MEDPLLGTPQLGSEHPADLEQSHFDQAPGFLSSDDLVVEQCLRPVAWLQIHEWEYSYELYSNLPKRGLYKREA